MRTAHFRMSSWSIFKHLRVVAIWTALAGIVVCSCSKTSELARLKAEGARGNPEAQYRLGVIYHEGVQVAPDYLTAAAWFRSAAAQGHAAAQFALGETYLQGEGMLADEVEAAKWIGKSAEQGYAPAQDELAVMYSNGAGVLQDDSEALKWASKAAEQGYADAQYHLGTFLSGQLPGKPPPDYVAACLWLSLAAANGHEASEELLAGLTAKLTPAQLDEVKRRVESWQRKHAAQRDSSSN